MRAAFKLVVFYLVVFGAIPDLRGFGNGVPRVKVRIKDKCEVWIAQWVKEPNEQMGIRRKIEPSLEHLYLRQK